MCAKKCIKNAQNLRKKHTKFTLKNTQNLHKKGVLKINALATILYSPSLPLRQNLKKMMHIGKSVAFGVSHL